MSSYFEIPNYGPLACPDCEKASQLDLIKTEPLNFVREKDLLPLKTKTREGNLFQFLADGMVNLLALILLIGKEPFCSKNENYYSGIVTTTQLLVNRLMKEAGRDPTDLPKLRTNVNPFALKTKSSEIYRVGNCKDYFLNCNYRGTFLSFCQLIMTFYSPKQPTLVATMDDQIMYIESFYYTLIGIQSLDHGPNCASPTTKEIFAKIDVAFENLQLLSASYEKKITPSIKLPGFAQESFNLFNKCVTLGTPYLPLIARLSREVNDVFSISIKATELDLPLKVLYRKESVINFYSAIFPKQSIVTMWGRICQISFVKRLRKSESMYSALILTKILHSLFREANKSFVECENAILKYADRNFSYDHFSMCQGNEKEYCRNYQKIVRSLKKRERDSETVFF